MNILFELGALFTEMELPFETGVFGEKAPEEYAVIIPVADQFDLFADNIPQTEVQEARVSLYSKGNFLQLRNRLGRRLLESDFTITDRRYVGYENDTQYHHYAIEVAKNSPVGVPELNGDGKEPIKPDAADEHNDSIETINAAQTRKIRRK